MVLPDSRSSTLRSRRSASAGSLTINSKEGTAHQQTGPALGDKGAIQDRCRAVVLVGADQPSELLFHADRGFRVGDLVPAGFEPGKWVQVADPWSGPMSHHRRGGSDWRTPRRC